MKLKLYILILFAGIFFCISCNKYDDERFDAKNADKNLFEQIQGTSNLSEFAKYLVQTGYDKLLSETKLFTVYAPTNEALEDLDTSIVNNLVSLKRFVSNHICKNAYFTHTPEMPTNIEMLSGKVFKIEKNVLKIDTINIIENTKDKVCTNGVLQVVANILPLKYSVWEYFIQSSDAPKQTNYLSNYMVKIFDQENSKKIGVYENSGKDKYDTVWVMKNRYLAEVADLTNEKTQYTLFMLTDKAFNSLFNQFRSYCLIKNSGSLTDAATNWAICNDLVFNGKFNSLPDSIQSVNGTYVNIIQSAVLKKYETSNGVVYLIDSLTIKLKNKIIPIKIEGENVDKAYSRVDLFDPSTFYGSVPNLKASGYQYWVVSNHNTDGFYIEYPVNNVYSISYDVYWVAYGTIAPAVSQTLGIMTDTLASFPSVKQTTTFAEVKLGRFTFGNYGKINLRVLSDGPSNPVNIDYIKLVPVLP